MAFEFGTEEREIPAKGIEATDAFLRIVSAFGRKYTFLLESIFDPKATGLAKRFSQLSLISFDPLLVIRSRGRRCELLGELAEKVGAKIKAKFERKRGAFFLGKREDPLHFLKEVMRQFKVRGGRGRFSFGPIGYAAYDLVRFFEPIPDVLPDRIKLPETYFVINRSAVIFDHARGKVRIGIHRRSGEKLRYKMRDLERMIRMGKVEIGGEKEKAEVRCNTSRKEFAHMVEKAREYIKKGDIFQVVLSRKFEVETNRDPIGVYFDLRKINPSPYMFYLDFGDFQFLGASPEVHVRLTGDLIEMRPIAGTRGRGRNAEEEKRIARELLGSEKERAEHTMLVDLCRNDIGRVAEFGSVREPELFIIEKYSHVQHIVSHVVGKLRKDKDAFDLVRATFPAGTVTGAPKVRAMEIIEELEKEKRGVYGGVVGYFDVRGNMDTCIAIRCVLMRRGKAYMQAGAGIVLDSTPAGEYIETRRKANSSLKAVIGRELEEG